MRIMFLVLFLGITLLLGGCASDTHPILKGAYQSEIDGVGYVVQMSFQPDNNSFVEYIEGREVDKGIYEKTSSNVYKLLSDKQSFQITLNKEDSFEIKIASLNNGNTIKMKKIQDTPIYIGTEFDDVEKYEGLLEQND
ncbi:hypothetical protein ACFSTA_14330 [Ornithinibacillus salinisoli]|uniref:DUF4825 domain-containing protein n=1 Tax=Ornithinibacillus salinisoli TaxID=1848459 RepID=A0ABW4VZV6_9BACI